MKRKHRTGIKIVAALATLSASGLMASILLFCREEWFSGLLIFCTTAIPTAGLLIWLCANWTPGGISILTRCAGALNGLGELLGMDGVILTAFLLSCPANELFLPLLLMGYLSTGVLAEPEDLVALGQLLSDSGWNGVTAVCVLLFTLFHWPCTTTCLTVWRETGTIRWAIAAALIPTLLGSVVCLAVASVARVVGLG